MSSQVYLNGKEVENPHEVHEHISPKSLYIKVLGTLLALTVLTVLVSEANLGNASLFVAMLVAVIKASLVVAFFMHLKYDDRYHLFIFLSTLIFVSIFFGFTLYDISARPALSEEMRTFTRMNEEANAGNPIKIGIEQTPEGAARCEEMRQHAAGGHGGEGHGPAVGHGEGEAGHEAKAGHGAEAGHEAKAEAGHEGGHEAKAGGH